MNYKQRVLNEMIELNWKIADLNHFISNNPDTKILEEQVKAMNIYSQILYERLIVMLEDKKEGIERG